MEPQKINWKIWNWKILQVLIHLKSRFTMRYDIPKATAHEMPSLEKGTERVELLPFLVSL